MLILWITMSKFSWFNDFLNFNIIIQLSFNSSFQTRINIYFKEDQFFAMERHELYGWIQFVANSGGLAGLFMGFSIVSVIETIYYIMIFKTKKEDQAVHSIEDPQTSSNEFKIHQR